MAEQAAGSGDEQGGYGGHGSGGAKVPRDEFVGRIVTDPANVSHDPMVLLSGWIGDSDQEGYTRIYCEPTLDCYADVSDDDILHHEEGGGPSGRVVWARRGAKVRYGRRGEGKTKDAAGFFSGQLVQDYGTGTGGGTGTGAGAQQVGPTGWLGCHVTHPAVCIPFTFQCLPPSIGCPQQAGGAAQAQPGPIGVTGWLGCNPTAATHCFVCPPITAGLGCPSTSTCPPATGGFGCPSSSTCPPQQGGGPVEAFAGHGGMPNTAATVCTQIGCAHTHMLGCPSSSTCPPHHTLATVCTLVHCHPQQNTTATVCTQLCPVQGAAGANSYQPACTLGFTCTYVGCQR